mmetsp:Transcript_13088/g.45774  ORF Transcript_13088/g.45774 Transcript_13088/m.45774 type:complete len:350 (-) Transcript_13088:114-1163(-)|eukprot:CAMPEP_0203812654 /NCGR_PEP_ID=MMETSP0115-20131106/4273_1 /ASSEMBLY_ACC=CAM_ASM_000227 /TAXON_ID=33651 /ORGANISM="Bicosoecid sp, Strain ms1" /LENGTH=349 /DNA_ID=CAMNT_0050721505 /DNA_START=170 /DNA_END=1219 /DNA_ORIENTATION=+
MGNKGGKDAVVPVEATDSGTTASVAKTDASTPAGSPDPDAVATRADAGDDSRRERATPADRGARAGRSAGPDAGSTATPSKIGSVDNLMAEVGLDGDLPGSPPDGGAGGSGSGSGGGLAAHTPGLTSPSGAANESSNSINRLVGEVGLDLGEAGDTVDESAFDTPASQRRGPRGATHAASASKSSLDGLLEDPDLFAGGSPGGAFVDPSADVVRAASSPEGVGDGGGAGVGVGADAAAAGKPPAAPGGPRFVPETEFDATKYEATNGAGRDDGSASLHSAGDDFVVVGPVRMSAGDGGSRIGTSPSPAKSGPFDDRGSRHNSVAGSIMTNAEEELMESIVGDDDDGLGM